MMMQKETMREKQNKTWAAAAMKRGESNLKRKKNFFFFCVSSLFLSLLFNAPSFSLFYPLLYCPLDHFDAAERASLAASLASLFAWRQSSDEEVKTSLSASRARSLSRQVATATATAAAATAAQAPRVMPPGPSREKKRAARVRSDGLLLLSLGFPAAVVGGGGGGGGAAAVVGGERTEEGARGWDDDMVLFGCGG